jgi:isocitrate dehydrogenase
MRKRVIDHGNYWMFLYGLAQEGHIEQHIFDMLRDKIRKMSPLPPPKFFDHNPGASSRKQVVIFREKEEDVESEVEWPASDWGYESDIQGSDSDTEDWSVDVDDTDSDTGTDSQLILKVN